MPRVTSSEHYKRHLFLRAAWTDFNSLYGLLTAGEQWEVHELYQPSCELTRDELVAHIRNLATTRPALVYQAGKHVRRMDRVFRAVSQELGISRSEWPRALGYAVRHYNPTPSPVGRQTKGDRHLTIVGVARPAPDVRLLVKALLGVARM